MACSAPLSGPYCGHCGTWNGAGSPPPQPDRVCPVCGTTNPPSNVHCQACAYRLDRTQEGNEASRPSNLSRFLALAAAVTFGVLGVVLIGSWIVGAGEPAASAPQSTTVTTEDVEPRPTSTVQPQQINVDSISASSSYSTDLGPENLIDGDPATYWNDASLHGEGAEVVLEFNEPVPILQLAIQNIADDVAFRRNFRIRGYEITADDLPSPVVGELDDSQELQRIEFQTEGSTVIRIRVTSTYPAETVDDLPPFEELAIAELRLLGSRPDG